MKNTVKRILCAAITMFLIAASLSGCFVPATDPNDTKKIDNGTASAEGTNNGTGGTPSGETTADAGKTASQVTISEQVLVDRDGVKITLKSLEDVSVWGLGLKMLIENNSGKDIVATCQNLVINDYMIGTDMAATVANGKKSNEIFYINQSSLDDAGITVIEKIDLAFTVSDSGYNTMFTEKLAEIKTSAFSGKAFAKADEGKELLNRDGIRIVGKYIKNDTMMGKEVMLFIENTGDKDITVFCDDISVNDFMVTTMFSQTVCAGKMAVDGVTIFSSDLEKNGITDIKNVELKFRVRYADSFNEIFTTDAIAFSAS
jgi:hypothetical protein